MRPAGDVHIRLETLAGRLLDVADNDNKTRTEQQLADVVYLAHESGTTVLELQAVLGAAVDVGALMWQQRVARNAEVAPRSCSLASAAQQADVPITPIRQWIDDGAIPSHSVDGTAEARLTQATVDALRDRPEDRPPV